MTTTPNLDDLHGAGLAGQLDELLSELRAARVLVAMAPADPRRRGAAAALTLALDLVTDARDLYVEGAPC